MKATTILERLERAAKLQMVNRTSCAYKLVKQAAENENPTIRPVWTSGRGRFCKNMDYTKDVTNLLSVLRIRYIVGNDAARGGLTGNFVEIKHLVK